MNIHDSRQHHQSSRVLLKEHFFCSRADTMSSWKDSHRLTISPIIANLFMENFRLKAHSILAYPPSLWRRYVHDKSTYKSEFLEHINSIDHCTQFTVENTRTDGSTPFLDTLVMAQSDGSLAIAVYRKPTHTDLYLQWDSHHTISAEYSGVSTLNHMARAVCSNPKHLQQDHL